MNYIERYWRDAKPEDAIKEPPMVARFRNEDIEDWECDLLVGWDRTDQCHWRSELDAFEHCQVYDAPDPGEGWRLIDPEKESPEEGDEFFEHGYWKTRRAKTDPFAKTFYYRRRIEPPNPEPKYVPFTWEDREQLRGRWICLGTSEVQIKKLTKDDKFYINGICPEVLVRYWTFVDTGEPVGKRVQ